MTVLVTGASGVVGHAAVRALLARDEVRAQVRRPEAAQPLRSLGAKVAVRELDTVDALAELLPRCHTLVHLVGGPDQPDASTLFQANHGSVLTAIDAARSAGTRRIAIVSVPGADPNAQHPFRRAKGLAEEALRGWDGEYAIVRSVNVYGLGGLWFTVMVDGVLAEPPFVVGPGDQELAPVYADDLGAVLAAIDDHPGELTGTWGLEGPDVVTADAFCSILRDDDEPPLHADGQAAAAILTRLLDRPVDAVTASFFAESSRADAPDAGAAFGVSKTRLRDGLRRTLAASTARTDR
jgi:uncharacterized protein YbjT (DUF2867 family)